MFCDALGIIKFLQLIDGGKVGLKDVASDIGISPDSLAAKLAVRPYFMTVYFRSFCRWAVFEMFLVY